MKPKSETCIETSILERDLEFVMIGEYARRVDQQLDATESITEAFVPGSQGMPRLRHQI